MQERRVAAGEVELVVAEAGAGGDPLLLVHGFTGAKEDFGDWFEALAARGWHVVAPDLRGHGHSTRPDDEAEYDFERYADDLAALADALGWDRFVLLGHSMGGMVAQVLALRAPDRIRALILMDTLHGPLAHVDRELAGAAAGIARTRGMDVLQALLEDATDPLASPADTRVKAERPGYAEYGARKLRTVSPAMYAAMLPAMLDADDRLEDLTRLTMPALVVVGEQDTGFVAASERMAATLPQATYRCVPDAGHSPQFEAPEAWWAAVSGFLDEVETERQAD